MDAETRGWIFGHIEALAKLSRAVAAMLSHHNKEAAAEIAKIKYSCSRALKAMEVMEVLDVGETEEATGGGDGGDRSARWES